MLCNCGRTGAPAVVVQFACDPRFLLFAHLLQVGRKLTQFFARLPLRTLRFDAFGNIAQHHCVEACVAVRDLRNGRLQRKFLAVGAQTPQHALGAHLPVGHACHPELFDVTRVRRAKPLGDEAIERRADRIHDGTAEHLFRHRIEDDDALMFVDGDDRLLRSPDDGHHPGFAHAGLTTLRACFCARE